ncbi:MAG: TA system antitoxin ParD family protein [Syntrophales bacterium]
MPKAVKISDELASNAAIFAGVEGRSLAGQVEYWAKLGRLADENADLPVSLIKEILIARAQVQSGLKTPYVFGEGQ